MTIPAAFANPSFIPTGQAGAQHPVPAQLAILLNSRHASTYCQGGDIIAGPADGSAPWSPPHGRRACLAAPGARIPRPPRIPPSTARTEWARREPGRQRLGNPAGTPRTACRRVAPSTPTRSWQFDVGLDFDIGQEWTGEFYLSHGESATYNVAVRQSVARTLPAARCNRPTMAAARRSPATSRPTAHARSSGPPTSRVPRASTTRTSSATSRSRRTATRRSMRRCRRARRTSRTSSS